LTGIKEMLSDPCADTATIPPIPKEISMRILALAILAIGAVSASAPARAQAYDPNYPVCMQVYGRNGGYIDCSFMSLPQCNATASGRSAMCLLNPYAANAQAPVGRSYRHRRTY
jgi:hypothetical protein